MKTVDEVIAIAEHCLKPMPESLCATCPSESKTNECHLFEDMLHYLKEYKIKRTMIFTRIQACDNREQRLQEEIALYLEAVRNCEEAENKYRQLAQGEVGNLPLTWDELKTMEGKPIWVEHIYYKKWLIVKEVYEETIVLDGNGFYTQYFSDDNEIETRWQAYRKERG